MYEDILEVEIGEIYFSKKSKRPFKVIYKAHHGQDCSIPMVVYVNLERTSDKDAGTIWCIEESMFIRTFLK